MKSQTGFIEAPDARIYFERRGQGPPLLFLHAGVADLRMWDAQVDAMQDSFDCIRFDMRGFGRTENKAETFVPSDDVATVLDHLEVDRAHLAGLSMGGAFIVDFALRFPTRARSLTLAAAGVGGWEGSANEVELAEMGETEKVYEAKDWDRVAELEVQYWLDGPGRAGRVQGEVRERMLEMCRRAYGRAEPDPRIDHLDPPAIQRLSEILAPTLVLIGTYDESSVQEIADVFESRIPNSRKIVYEGVAHMINLEEPERFNSDLMEFLASASA